MRALSKVNTENPSRAAGVIYRITCIGRTPLLMDPMKLEGIWKETFPGPKKPELTPVQEAAEKIYRDSDGRVGLPTGMLFASLRSAGRTVRVGQRILITKYGGQTTLPAIMVIRDKFLALKHPEFKDFDGAWVADMKYARLFGRRYGIVRPRFDKWGFEVNIDVNYFGFDGLTEAHIRELFRKSGRNTGLGSFRPATGGRFGTFDVVEFKRR